jgi:hypothetical protein
LFGDGTSLNYSSANANPMHTYSANGNYNVIMILLDFWNACSDTGLFNYYSQQYP